MGCQLLPSAEIGVHNIFFLVSGFVERSIRQNIHVWAGDRKWNTDGHISVDCRSPLDTIFHIKQCI